MLLNLFIKNTMFLQDYYHADLHDSNWKVVFTNNMINPSIVLYDFGFCIKNSKQNQTSIINMHKSMETNNQLQQNNIQQNIQAKEAEQKKKKKTPSLFGW